MAVPQSAYEAQLKQAIIGKAVRFYEQMQAPLGMLDLGDLGSTRVGPDFQTQELLYGLRFRGVPYDLSTLVTVNDVIRAGLEIGAGGSLASEKQQDVQRALDAACAWIETELNEGIGIG